MYIIIINIIIAIIIIITIVVVIVVIIVVINIIIIMLQSTECVVAELGSNHVDILITLDWLRTCRRID